MIKRPGLRPVRLLREATLAVMALGWSVACSTPPSTLAPTPISLPPATLAVVASPLFSATHTPTITPTQTLTPTPTSTPAPLARPLTTGGCCVQPFWSADNAEVWFIDRPAEAQPAGIWGVGLMGGEPRLVTTRLGLYSPDRALVAYPENQQTVIERLADGVRWIAPTDGRAVSFSPDSTRFAWQVAPESADGNFDQRLVEVWVANVDGTQPQQVARLVGGGLSGWFPDGTRLLISGLENTTNESSLSALSLADGALTPIAQGPRLRGGTLSPDGGWVAYQIQFSGDPARDGLWVTRTDGSESRRLEIFGAYRWRDASHLLVVPLELGAGGQRFVEVEVATSAVQALTDPALTPIHIEGGDWSLSPDGARVVFVSADDHNLWVIELPR
jgi:hypothetical protein